jgi:hypothetical protein
MKRICSEKKSSQQHHEKSEAKDKSGKIKLSNFPAVFLFKK